MPSLTPISPVRPDEHRWLLRTQDSGPTTMMAFSADDAELWWATEEGIVWIADAKAGSIKRRIRGRKGIVLATGGDPDHMLLGMGSFLMVNGRESASWLHSIDGGFNPLKSGITAALALDEDAVLTGHADGVVRRWSLSTGKVVRGQYKVAGSKSPIRMLAADGQGGFVAGAEGRAWWWTLDPKVKPVELPVGTARYEPVRVLEVDPSGEAALVGTAKAAAVFGRDGAVRTEIEVGQPLRGGGYIGSDGARLWFAADHTPILAYDLEAGEWLGDLRGGATWVATRSHDGTQVACGHYDRVSVFDVERDAWTWTSRRHAWFEILKGGARVLSADAEGRVYVWSPGGLVEYAHEPDDERRVFDVAWVDDAVVRIVYRDGGIVHWWVETDYLEERIEGGKVAISGVSPVGEAVALFYPTAPARLFRTAGASAEALPALRGVGRCVESPHGWVVTKGREVLLVDPETFEIQQRFANGDEDHYDKIVVHLACAPGGEVVFARSHTELFVLALPSLERVAATDQVRHAAWVAERGDALWVLDRDDRVSRWDWAADERDVVSPELTRPTLVAALGGEQIFWVNQDGATGVLGVEA